MKYLELLRAQIAELMAERDAHIAAMDAAAEALEARRAAEPDETARRSLAFTDDELAAIDEARAKLDEIKPQLDELQAREAELAAEQERRAAAKPAPTFLRRHDEALARPAIDEVPYLRPNEARDKALAMLEGRDDFAHLDGGVARSADLPFGGRIEAKLDADDVRSRVEKLIRTRSRNLNGDHIARMLLITESAEYRSAFQKLVTQPVPLLTPDEARAVQAYSEFRAMNEGTPSAGGYGVPVLIDPSIILTAQGSLNPFRRIARVETITTNAWKGVSSAGVTWSYDAEAAEVSDDSPTLAQPVVNIHTARGFIPYSLEIGDDYPSFASEMATCLLEGYDELQAEAFAVGAGDASNQPYGIITALDANTNVEVTVTTNGALSGGDINKVWKALPDRYKSNATWVMSHGVGAEIATFGNNNALSFVTVDLTGVVETIRTRPVEYASYFPDFTGTTNAANILVLGDFRNYLIADRAGMSVELVPHLVGTNRRPTGQRGWFAWARHGADSINDLGFRLLQNSA